MGTLKKRIAELEKVVGRKIQYESEENGLQTEGKTIFRFAFQGQNYIGAVDGQDGQAVAFAALLPAQLEGNSSSRDPLTKMQLFKKLFNRLCYSHIIFNIKNFNWITHFFPPFIK